MKKLLAILLTLVMASGLVACSGDDGSDGDGATTGGKTTAFSVAIASTPETLDPHLNSAADGGTYLAHLGEGLYRYKWDGEGVELGLAEKVDVSDDGMTLTVKIRDDATWSDGQPITAQDFEYSFKRLVNPDTAAPYAGDMGRFLKNGEAISAGEADVDTLGIEVVDDKNLVLTLSGPCAFIDEVLAFATFQPVRQDMIEEHGDRWTLSPETYISSGPYMMSELADDEHMKVVPNDKYYDKDSLVATEITFEFLATDQVNLTAFKAGEIVFAKEFPIEEQESMDAEGVAYTNPLLGTYYISLNNNNEYLKNPDLRKALILAVDRDYIADTVMEGTVTPAGAIIGAGFLDENDDYFVDTAETYYDPSDYEGNLELAKQALVDAGYPNGEGLPTFQYTSNDLTSHKLIAEALQDMWSKIGVNIEISMLDWNVFTADRREGNFEIARNGWLSDYNDPSSMLNLFYSTSGNNDAKYNNSEFDALLDIANTSGDQAERMQAMRDAESILIAEDWGACPIYSYKERYLVTQNLKDWACTPTGYQFFHLAYLED